MLKTWSSTQATVALSSAEAEYSALVKAASIGLGFQSLLRDLGVESDYPFKLYCDSSAAIGIASRVGLGKIRHLAVHLLWLQQLVQNRSVEVLKVLGHKNVADILTKCVPGNLLVKHLKTAGFEGSEAHKSQRGLL